MQSSRASDCDRGEGGDVGRIAARIANRKGEMAMPCLEGIPHRIFEEIRWQIVHSLEKGFLVTVGGNVQNRAQPKRLHSNSKAIVRSRLLES